MWEAFFHMEQIKIKQKNCSNRKKIVIKSNLLAVDLNVTILNYTNLKIEMNKIYKNTSLMPRQCALLKLRKQITQIHKIMNSTL